jgi:NAD+ synthase
MNVKSRVRANILYSFANTFQALVLGTSNLSETRLGYGTKHGDLAADVEVIGALYKTQVRALAGYLGIAAKIIDKAPTAELEAGQSDANELGADYAELDTILVYGPNSIELGADPVLIKHVAELERKSMHKREMPPIISYTEDAY